MGLASEFKEFIFVQSIFDFLIIAWAIFAVIRLLNQLKRPPAPPAPPAPPETPRQEVLLKEIRDFLRQNADTKH